MDLHWQWGSPLQRPAIFGREWVCRAVGKAVTCSVNCCSNFNWSSTQDHEALASVFGDCYARWVIPDVVGLTDLASTGFILNITGALVLNPVLLRWAMRLFRPRSDVSDLTLARGVPLSERCRERKLVPLPTPLCVRACVLGRWPCCRVAASALKGSGPTEMKSGCSDIG